jgi:transcriptional regulator with PAS, ATPase and Fis domain
MRHEGSEQLIGASGVIAELSQEIDRIARSDAKVLITGESGVGKELVAHAIHQRSPRSGRPMVAVNCAGLPETLLESELFGHVKGSFTGAYRDKQGKLEMADRGSIFLDEIGEMTLRMQGLLLRFMETGELQKVGADRIAGRVNVRVIAATNRNLRDMISEGTFREDLFYRLNVIHLVVPPLRERREDIPSLIDHFMNRFTRNNGHPVKFISPDANKLLCEYSWPGNVRELENVIERLVVTGRSESVMPEHLPMEVRSQQSIGLRPKKERRRTVADDLYKKLVEERESFWTVVYPLYMQREITRGNVRDLVRKGLEDARGNYKIVAKLFNMESRDYKRFLNFLRKHDCQLPFQRFRSAPMRLPQAQLERVAQAQGL